KAGGRFFLKIEARVRAARHINQDRYFERHLVRVSDLRNLLRATLFLKTKVSYLQATNWFAFAIDYGHRHHHQVRVHADHINIFRANRGRRWCRFWFESRRRWRVGQLGSLRGDYVAKKK